MAFELVLTLQEEVSQLIEANTAKLAKINKERPNAAS